MPQAIGILTILIGLITGIKAAEDSLQVELTQQLKLATHDTTRCKIINQILKNSAPEKFDENKNQIWPIYQRNFKQKTINPQVKKVLINCLASTLYYCALDLEDKEKSENAVALFKKCLHLQEIAGNTLGMANTLNELGRIHFNEGDFKSSHEFHLQSLQLRLKSKDLKAIAKSYNNIGAIYKEQGDIPHALEYFNESLRIRTKIKDDKGLVLVLNNMASIYKVQGEIEKALEYFNKSLLLQKKIGDKKILAKTYNSIGVLYYDQNDDKTALSYYQKSLKIREAIGDKMGIAESLSNIGGFYYSVGDPNLPPASAESKKGGYEKAIVYTKKALEIQEKINHVSGLISSLNNLCVSHLQLNKTKEALEYCQKSIALSTKIGNPELIRNSAMNQYRVYKAMKQTGLALQNYELFVQMNDHIINEENKKVSIKSQLKYEYEKKAAADSAKAASEKEVIEVQLQHEKIQRVILYSGLGLVGVFALFMVNRFRIIRKQKRLIEEQKIMVEKQKHIVEEKQNEILDSIHYAKRIQTALLTHEYYFKRELKRLNS